MEINTQFYTTAQEDVSGRYGMKRFSKTFKSMITDGELPINTEWDMSISPFAINAVKHPNASYPCDIIKKCWIFPDMNNLKNVEEGTPETPDMVLKYRMYADQTYYPFMMYSGDGGQGNGWAFPYWYGRVGYNQTLSGDFTNYKWNLYGITKYDYKRLVWVIYVYVSYYGHNNPELTTSNLSGGSWTDLSNVSDATWAEILSGQRSITGVRFIPYYANSSDSNRRYQSYTTGLYAMAMTEPLDGSASCLGSSSPYTEDYIDYAMSIYAGYGGSNDSEGSRGGNPTLSLGCIGEYGNNSFALEYRGYDWDWFFYDSLAAWATDYFTQSTAYQKNATDSVYWVNEPHQANDYQYLYFRQHLNTDVLNTKELCREYLITQCAYLGGFFTDNYLTATDGTLTDTDMYLGIIESDGLTAGRYQRGLDIIIPDIDNPWTDVGWTPPAPEGAFKNATNLVKVRIPQSCSTIGRYAFEDTKLTKVTVASDCTYYNTSFPSGCVVNFYPD